MTDFKATQDVTQGQAQADHGKTLILDEAGERYFELRPDDPYQIYKGRVWNYRETLLMLWNSTAPLRILDPAMDGRYEDAAYENREILAVIKGKNILSGQLIESKDPRLVWGNKNISLAVLKWGTFTAFLACLISWAMPEELLGVILSSICAVFTLLNLVILIREGKRDHDWQEIFQARIEQLLRFQNELINQIEEPRKRKKMRWAIDVAIIRLARWHLGRRSRKALFLLCMTLNASCAFFPFFMHLEWMYLVSVGLVTMEQFLAIWLILESQVEWDMARTNTNREIIAVFEQTFD